jgi:hypothetical protein
MTGRFIAIASVLLIATAGCSNLSEREQRALTGGALGAAGGLVIGAVTGGPLVGALIGTGAGAAIGALLPGDLFGNHKK